MGASRAFIFVAVLGFAAALYHGVQGMSIPENAFQPEANATSLGMQAPLKDTNLDQEPHLGGISDFQFKISCDLHICCPGHMKCDNRSMSCVKSSNYHQEDSRNSTATNSGQHSQQVSAWMLVIAISTIVFGATSWLGGQGLQVQEHF